MKLTPCSSCARLVRIADAACPFCGAAIERTDASSAVAKHLSRAAMLVGAAAIGVACGGVSEPVYGAPVPPDAAADASPDGPVAMYGGPPVDGGLDAAPDGPVAAYGGPPFDAGQLD